MSIQQQLNDEYRRTSAPTGVQAGAYDRFLRRRARYALAVAGTSVMLLLALVLGAVVVPRVLADRPQPVLNPPHPAQQGQVVRRLEYGYELTVPTGWRVAAQHRSGEVWLVPTAQPERSAVPAIIIGSTVLKPAQYPDNPNGDPGQRLDNQLGSGFTYRPIDGPYRSGRREDGRPFHLQGTVDSPSGQTYYLAWAYHCADGARCPLALRFRALTVTGFAEPGDRRAITATQAALRRVVETIRPVGNALPGGAASRPACQLDLTDDRRQPAAPSQGGDSPSAGVSVITNGTQDPGAAGFVLSFSAVDLAMCHLRASFTVELLEGGRPAAVQGNGIAVTVEGDLPEGDGQSPTLARAWLWRNWCGGHDVSLRLNGPGNRVIPAKEVQRPGCVDPGKPSTLESTAPPVR
jgi:hypothetical protein